MEANDHTINPGTDRSDAKLGVYILVLMVFWTTTIAYTVHPVLPANPLELPLETHNPFVKLLPQGWGFFTRDPRSMDMTTFVKTSTSWQSPPSASKTWPRMLEFSRRRKLTGVEAGLILDAIPEPEWQECKEAPTACLDKAPVNETVENKQQQPTLCGDVGIVRQPPIPWAWSQTPDETVMPSEVLRIQVSCK